MKEMKKKKSLALFFHSPFRRSIECPSVAKPTPSARPSRPWRQAAVALVLLLRRPLS